MSAPFDTSLDHARSLDVADPLAPFRQRFHIPLRHDAAARRGEPVVYMVGNSLGLQPRGVREDVIHELEDWSRLGVDAHFEGRDPWYPYHEKFRGPLARLVGAREDEVVAMNSVTVNLHLMLVSFYRPEGSRRKLLIEENAFPSDLYAATSQIAHHRLDPEADLIVAKSRPGEHHLRTEDVVELIERTGDELACVMLGGVNYFSGQLFDIKAISAAARKVGSRVGFDLAHAAGNVPLALHDWDVDFAVWCSYKYLNGGPGAIAGCFVHERNCRDADLARFAGWWGNDPGTRFGMHLVDHFVPVHSADGWQLSNPPILSLAPLKGSLAVFDEAGMPALREKSLALTGYLEALVSALAPGLYEQITPADPGARGSQLSLRIRDDGRAAQERLQRAGVVSDFRPPDVVRIAPVPLYNSFEDVWKVGQALASTGAPSEGGG